MRKEELVHKEHYDFNDLQMIMKALRAEDGCPWDRVQTHESIRKCLTDECEEVIQAIDNRDMENLKEELGDVLFQVIMHSEIASEAGEFNIDDVIDGICRKMVFRHPHVFNGAKPEDVDWQELKQLEKAMKGQNKTNEGENFNKKA